MKVLLFGEIRILLFGRDELAGLDDIVHRAFSKSGIRRCIAHKVHNKDINEFIVDLKVYINHLTWYDAKQFYMTLQLNGVSTINVWLNPGKMMRSYLRTINILFLCENLCILRGRLNISIKKYDYSSKLRAS